MHKLNSITDKFAGRAAILGGAALVAGGVTEIVHSQSGADSQVVGVAGYLTLSFFIVALISIAPSFIALARRARSRVAAWAALAAAAGTTILGLTSITSIVNGHDLALFNVLAPLTNAAWLLGSIVIAVSLKRAGTVPTAVAIGLPLAWVATIPLATLGGGVLSGAYYLAVGYLLAHHADERTAPAAAQPPNPAPPSPRSGHSPARLQRLQDRLIVSVDLVLLACLMAASTRRFITR